VLKEKAVTTTTNHTTSSVTAEPYTGEVRTDGLRAGDVVRHDGIRTVTHTQPAEDGRVLVVFDDATVDRWPADARWTKATDAEILAARAAVARLGMARALEHLADLIREHPVAPTIYSIDVSVVTATIAGLQTWADALGRPISPGGTAGRIPVIRADDTARFGDIRLDLRVQAQEQFPATDSPQPASPTRDQTGDQTGQRAA
jgi:hypothetical protein